MADVKRTHRYSSRSDSRDWDSHDSDSRVWDSHNLDSRDLYSRDGTALGGTAVTKRVKVLGTALKAANAREAFSCFALSASSKIIMWFVSSAG